MAYVGLMLLVVILAGCREDKTAYLVQLEAAEQTALQPIPVKEARTVALSDSVLHLPTAKRDSVLSDHMILTSNLLHRHKVYRQLFDYVNVVDSVSNRLIDDAKLRQFTQTLIHLNQALSYGELGLLDRTTNIYLEELNAAKGYGFDKLEMFVYNNLSTIYIEQQRYDEALKMLDGAIASVKQMNQPNPNYLGFIYTNIGDVYANQGNINKALEYHFMGLNHMKDTLDTRYTAMKRNIADDYLRLKQWDMALQQMGDVVTTFEGHHVAEELSMTYSMLARIRWGKGDLSEAHRLFEQSLVDLDSAVVTDRLKVLDHYLRFCQLTGDTGTEVKVLRLLQQLNDNIRNDNERRVITSKLYEEELQRNDASLTLFHTTIRKYQWWLAGLVVLIGMMVGGTAWLARWMRGKQRQVEYSRDAMHEQLTRAQAETERAQGTVAQLRSDLQQLQRNVTDSTPRSTVSELRKITRRAQQAENDKDNSADAWAIANPAFYNTLLERWPSLTKVDLKLCSLLRQGLSSKEIAEITNKSSHGIDVARNRLRRKLGLEPREDITLFLLRLTDQP